MLIKHARDSESSKAAAAQAAWVLSSPAPLKGSTEDALRTLCPRGACGAAAPPHTGQPQDEAASSCLKKASIAEVLRSV